MFFTVKDTFKNAEQLKRYYAGRKVIVTGATSGNGRALAAKLLDYGATVIGIGRRPERLEAFRVKGGIPYALDLSKPEQVLDFVRWFSEHYGLCNNFFHLAGGALVGNKDEQAVQAFAASDLTGPLLLAEHVKPYMAADSTMALVTSIAAALPATPGLEKYAAVKGGIVKWCAEKFVPYSADGVHVMLIAMGPIWTEAGRGEHAQGFFQNLVKFILPLPEQFSNLILKDAMNHERVSYPGFMAKLGEYKNNVYAIRFGPFIRNAFLLVLALGAWVMKRKEKMDGKLLNKKYPNV